MLELFGEPEIPAFPAGELVTKQRAKNGFRSTLELGGAYASPARQLLTTTNTNDCEP